MKKVKKDSTFRLFGKTIPLPPPKCDLDPPLSTSQIKRNDMTKQEFDSQPEESLMKTATTCDHDLGLKSKKASFSDALQADRASPMLGKHSRTGNILGQPNTRKEDVSQEEREDVGAWIPKTLRIDDDPIEVAKSSIRSIPQNKDGKNNNYVNGMTFCDAFESKGDTTDNISLALDANPAALFPSLN